MEHQMTSTAAAIAENHVRDPQVTGAEMVRRAREISKLLAEQSYEAEKLRRPTDAVIKALEEAELFKILAPRIYGGFELDLDTFFEVGLALSEGDASMAWVANFYIEHVWIFALFPHGFQEEVFAGKGYALAPAMLSPNGIATKVEGGYRLKGRWSWSTGIMHADWVIPAAIITQDDGKRVPMFFALPRSEVTVEDVWFVDGMQGTGSNDVLIDDVFIPESRMLSFADMIEGDTPGGRLHGNPLYRTPMLPTLGLAAAMPALGQARACLRMFKERLQERMAVKGTRRVGTASYMRLARAEMQIEQTYYMLQAMVREVIEIRNNSTRLDRTRWATQLAYAVSQCKEAVNYIGEVAGASGHFQSSPLGRAQRDINVVAAHIVFDLDARLELHGAAMLGEELPGILV
jgi:3-hydroxy-9,10-secoandrosta-1,3,5(10)-triene-9,17-dione monooxygenase